ncbi:MAG: hypothetical protein Q9160_000285 [Pyrenula sp. 1 TL-2023]
MQYKSLFILAIAAGLLDGVVAQGFGQGGFGGQGAGKGGQGQGQGKGGANGGKGGNGAGAAAASGANGAAAAAATGTAGAGGNANGGGNAAAGGNELCLSANNVQTASQSDGQDAGAEAGQAPSATDNANFINFCTGETLTNGLQVKGGSCNGIATVMGKIPSTANMISSIITNPGPGDNIQANQDFNIDVQTQGLVAGSFTNPDNTYYGGPQDLQGGKVIGHTHVTVQAMGNTLTPATPPDPTEFAFFKGINDAGDGQGGLTAAVAGGLPAGVYRVCTMTSASNHQPVLMPVAQRGAQDDCNKFTVGGAGGNQGGKGAGNAVNGGGNAAAGGNAGTGTAGAGNAAASGTANAGGNAGKGGAGGAGGAGKGGKGGKGRFRFARRNFIA